jgi:zinc protease
VSIVIRSSLALLAGVSCFAIPALAAETTPAPVSALVRQIDIPYQGFTLKNGLRVIVHTDRKAPIVATSIWYHVGSKDEPKGKTGFAHLFEHLMFNGSENAPGDYFEPMEQIGATDLNGTTWFDRTNYFETVPTGALERTLFLESDRMGHLLGAVTQEKLDNQRGVVQNEKRQGDNDPFGLVDYVVYDTLFPGDHPYRHATIGSMADLNGATLEDVKNWFRARYGPDNAVLVLAGDIDMKTAKPLVEKWFGAIPRGPAVSRVKAEVPTLAAPVSKVLKDQVPFTRIARYWAVEGVNGKDTTNLEVAAAVLGGLSSSRLDNALVRQEKIAVAVTAGVQDFEQVGVLTVSADVKPGQDPALVAKRLDQLIADFLRDGPTADEVRRVATRSVSSTIGGYESVGGFGGKAVALAEGAVYSSNAAKYKADLQALAAVTPASAKAAARKWMSRPVFNLTVEPGPRDNSPAMRTITGDLAKPAGRGPLFYRAPGRTLPPVMASAKPVDRSTMPPVGTLAELAFPAIERATLSNGIPIVFARRSAVPIVRVAVSFDAGFAADAVETRGVHSLMLALLDEGTTSRSSIQIAEEQERLGAGISSSSSIDRTTIGLYAPALNLAPSLDLLADIVRNPAFAPAEVERLRGQQLSRIAAQMTDPGSLGRFVLPGLIFGKNHPYGAPGTGTGDAATVARVSRDAIVNFHASWIRPEKAQIFVVGDTSLAAIKPMLEARFGSWKGGSAAPGRKDLSAATPTPGAKIYLIDRPNSPQSVILGAQLMNQTPRDDLLAIKAANEVLGGSFLSRLNIDLRETKGWSYGVGSAIRENEARAYYFLQAPVQADKTGDAIKVLIADTRAFLGEKGTTPGELERTINGFTRSLPGDFETSDAVLGALQRIVWLGRPDDYYATLPARYRALSAAQLDQVARATIDPGKFTFVVVGDAAKIRGQLDATGLPVETVTLPKAP